MQGDAGLRGGGGVLCQPKKAGGHVIAVQDAVLDKENLVQRSGNWGQSKKGGGFGGHEFRKEKLGVLAPNATLGNGGGLTALELLKERVKVLKLNGGSRHLPNSSKRTEKSLTVKDEEGSTKLSRSSGVWGEARARCTPSRDARIDEVSRSSASQGIMDITAAGPLSSKIKDELSRWKTSQTNMDMTAVGPLSSKITGASSSGSSFTPCSTGMSPGDEDTMKCPESTEPDASSAEKNISSCELNKSNNKSRLAKRFRNLVPGPRLLVSGPALRVLRVTSDGKDPSGSVESHDSRRSTPSAGNSGVESNRSSLSAEEVEKYAGILEYDYLWSDHRLDPRKRKAEQDPSRGYTNEMVDRGPSVVRSDQEKKIEGFVKSEWQQSSSEVSPQSEVIPRSVPSTQKIEEVAGLQVSMKELPPATNVVESQVKNLANLSEGTLVSAQKISENAHFVWVNDKRYQKLGKIGKGGSAEVYKVIDSDCNIYAMKKINLKGRDHGAALGFYQEIEYLERLRGKRNVVQLICYGVTNRAVILEDHVGEKISEDACIYMVLEFGEIDLAGILSKKKKEMLESNETIDNNWLRFYWKHMLLAVKTIHDERIVHADLKPANFLLVKGELKLIDFGIAKAIQNDTTHIVRDTQVGTLNYMSPEAFLTNSKDEQGRTVKCGRASDIWSLGCILYQMVYGHTPFSHITSFYAKIQAITSKTCDIEFPPIPDPWLLDLMKKCLTWDRNSRPHISDLLQHPFLCPELARQDKLPFG